MAKFTLTRAATETGLSKSAISTAIRAGRLPAEKKGNAYQIEAEDLKAFVKAPTERRKPRGVVAESQRLVALETDNKTLRKQLTKLRQHLADLEDERDRWARQAEHMSQLTRSNQRAIQRTSKDLAELRKEALMRAREAAEAEARRAQETADPQSESAEGYEGSADAASDGWPRRFGLRSI